MFREVIEGETIISTGLGQLPQALNKCLLYLFELPPVNGRAERLKSSLVGRRFARWRSHTIEHKYLFHSE